MSTGDHPLAALRAQFPVLARVAYLNAGTNGPVAARATAAARAVLEQEEADGRGGMPYFTAMQDLHERVRAGYAARLGAAPADVAVTTSTTDGVSRALLALDLSAGDVVLTSDEEHPGVYGPLAAQRARGVEVRVAPFAEIADAVTADVRLVVCSHVSWMSGALAPAALADVDPLVLLDGAQAVGAIDVDVRALGADLYAGPGQKWLCGQGGLGMLYVAPELRERIVPPSPGYLGLEDPGAGAAAVPRADAQAYDTPALPVTSLAHAAATLDLLEETGWDAIHAHAHGLAARLVEALGASGRSVLPRDNTTLVTWEEPDAPAVAERLAEQGVIVRFLPGERLLRASVGGWSDEGDLDRLLAALPPR